MKWMCAYKQAVLNNKVRLYSNTEHTQLRVACVVNIANHIPKFIYALNSECYDSKAI